MIVLYNICNFFFCVGEMFVNPVPEQSKDCHRYLPSTMFIFRHFLCFLLFASLVLSAATWQERREAIFQQAKEEAVKQADEQVTVESVLEELGLSKMPEAPTVSPGELVFKEQAAFQQALDKEFPPSFLDELPDKAEKKFPLAQLNDIVSIRMDLPSSNVISGKLIKRDETRAIIGSKWVRYQDMAKESSIFLDPTENRRQREKWMEMQKTIFLQSRKIRAASLQKSIKKMVMEEAGFLSIEDDEDNEGHWTPALKAVNDRLAEQRKSCSDRLYPQILQNLMQENGFIFLKTQNQWRPSKGEGAPSMMEKLKEKLN